MGSNNQAFLCLEPRIQGPRHSGGFFYNDCLSAAAKRPLPYWFTSQDQRLPSFSVQSWDGGRLPSALVLLDSLWWYVHQRPLDLLADALVGRTWGLIMHGLPELTSVLFADIAKASFVVVPSYWAAGQLETLRSSLPASARLELRVLYPGWDGRPGLQPKTGWQPQGGDTAIRIVSTSNWMPEIGRAHV